MIFEKSEAGRAVFGSDDDWDIRVGINRENKQKPVLHVTSPDFKFRDHLDLYGGGEEFTVKLHERPNTPESKEKKVNFKPEKGKCKFTDHCTKQDCKFTHPPRPQQEKKAKTIDEIVDGWNKAMMVTHSVAAQMKKHFSTNPGDVKIVSGFMNEAIGSGAFPAAKSFSGKWRAWMKIRNQNSQIPQQRAQPISPAPNAKEAAQKKVAQAADCAELPRVFEMLIFNQVRAGNPDRKMYPHWNVYVKTNGRFTLFEKTGVMQPRGSVFKFIYRLAGRDEWISCNADLYPVHEKTSDKTWFSTDRNLDVDAIMKDVDPYVVAAREEIKPRIPTGEPTPKASTKEGKSRNGWSSTVLASHLFSVWDKDEDKIGDGIRIGKYGWLAKHVYDAVTRTNGKLEFKIKVPTAETMIKSVMIDGYDMVYFTWPTTPPFQAVSSATWASDVTLQSLYERQKVNVVFQYEKDGQLHVGTSCGVTDMENPKGLMRADYETPGGGSSGAPVFTMVAPGGRHVVGLHVEYDKNTEKCWFAVLTPEMRKRLNSQTPSQA